MKDIVTWPEFRPAWILLAVIGAAFALDAVTSKGSIILFGEGGLLFMVFVFVVWIVYKAAAAERAMKIDRSELRSILGSLNDALIVYDENFNAIFFNPAAERLF